MRDVGVLGDQAPQPRCVPRCVRVRLEHNGVTGRKRGPELVEDDLDREIARRDRSDNTDRLLDDGSHVPLAEQSSALERALPCEFVDQPAG